MMTTCISTKETEQAEVINVDDIEANGDLQEVVDSQASSSCDEDANVKVDASQHIDSSPSLPLPSSSTPPEAIVDPNDSISDNDDDPITPSSTATTAAAAAAPLSSPPEPPPTNSLTSDNILPNRSLKDIARDEKRILEICYGAAANTKDAGGVGDNSNKSSVTSNDEVGDGGAPKSNSTTKASTAKTKKKGKKKKTGGSSSKEAANGTTTSGGNKKKKAKQKSSTSKTAATTTTATAEKKKKSSATKKKPPPSAASAPSGGSETTTTTKKKKKVSAGSKKAKVPGNKKDEAGDDGTNGKQKKSSSGKKKTKTKKKKPKFATGKGRPLEFDASGKVKRRRLNYRNRYRVVQKDRIKRGGDFKMGLDAILDESEMESCASNSVVENNINDHDAKEIEVTNISSNSKLEQDGGDEEAVDDDPRLNSKKNGNTTATAETTTTLDGITTAGNDSASSLTTGIMRDEENDGKMYVLDANGEKDYIVLGDDGEYYYEEDDEEDDEEDGSSDSDTGGIKNRRLVFLLLLVVVVLVAAIGGGLVVAFFLEKEKADDNATGSPSMSNLTREPSTSTIVDSTPSSTRAPSTTAAPSPTATPTVAPVPVVRVPTATPTMHPTNLMKYNDLTQILSPFIPAINNNSTDEQSPQPVAHINALQWMSNIDRFFIDTNITDVDGASQQILLERYIAVLLYFSTEGDLWIDNSFWLSPDLPVCDWRGITCNTLVVNDEDENNVVSQIKLQSNALFGSIPTELFLLTNLESLDFNGNSLTGLLLPTELGQLSRLTSLFLGSSISAAADVAGGGPIPTEIGLLTKLKEMRLSKFSDVEFVQSPLQFGLLTRHMLSDVLHFSSEWFNREYHKRHWFANSTNKLGNW